MNMEDCHDYFVQAAIKLYAPLPSGSLGDACLALDKALGVDLYRGYMTRPSTLDFPLPAHWRELLTKLAGPHGKTILRAYRIKRGLEP